MKRNETGFRRVLAILLVVMLMGNNLGLTAFADASISDPDDVYVEEEVISSDNEIPPQEAENRADDETSEDNQAMEEGSSDPLPGDNESPPQEAENRADDETSEDNQVIEEGPSDPLPDGTDNRDPQDEPLANGEQDDPEPVEEGPLSGPEALPFEQSMTVNGVVVTVRAEPGVFPANAALSVETVPVYRQRQADAAVDEVRDENQNVAVSYSFDIKVIDPETGEEYQPAEGQTVNVSFALAEVADENLETQVYHVTEDETTGELSAESLDVSIETAQPGEEEIAAAQVGDEMLAAVVETEGFSIYTVEYTYNNLQYVMDGGTYTVLPDILEAIGLTGEVTAVSVSDDSLFSVTNVDGNWVVTSHRAFSSLEWMKVTIGGVTYEVTVTDSAQDTFDEIFYGSDIIYLDEAGQRHRVNGYSWLTKNTTVLMGGVYITKDTDYDTEIPRIVLYNDTTLVIGPGMKTKGIYTAGFDLTIYQEENSGSMLDAGADGIYGYGHLTLCSGNVQVTDYDNNQDHPMFGAEKGTFIKGGKLGVRGGDGGALGGPWPVTISGGRVEAFNTAYGAGIGGGSRQAGYVTITGGTVEATAYYSAGIGNGAYGAGGSIKITGGTVKARGMSGIGGGLWEGYHRCMNSGPITITGGKVTAEAYGRYNTSGLSGICTEFVSGAGLTLGWTTTGDRITGNFVSGNYHPGSVTLENYFWLGSSGGTGALPENLDGRTLIPSTTPNVAQVKYHTYGADQPWKAQTVGVNSTTLTDPGNPYAGVAGYRFDGWKAGSFGGNAYSFGTPVTGDLDLYAALSYRVTLKYGNGEADTIEYVTRGGNLSKPADPTQNAATFLGWRKAGESGDYNFSSPVDAPFTLEAQWEYQGIAYAGGHTNSYTAMNALGGATLSSGDYVLTQDTQLDDRLTVSGTVNLILCDGYTLTLSQGITVVEGNALNIYGQSGNTGKLRVTGAPDNCAGIGSNVNYFDRDDIIHSGQITIYGGDIEAAGGTNGAGIGGGHLGDGHVTIYGGQVKATGGEDGAGIGACAFAGYVTIYGGQVTGTGSGEDPGIGGGRPGFGYVTITGGQVTGIGGGAGIGAGNVTITGGEITARGGSYSAGIGGGDDSPGNVTISGGTIVEATGGWNGAGIGSGRNGKGIVNISGGIIVNARGGEGAAGIGGGREGKGTVTITGGDITATRGNKWAADIGKAGTGSGEVIFQWGDGPIVVRSSNVTNPRFEKSFMVRDTGELADSGNMTGVAIVPCCALRFDADGGEGEMAAVTVARGQQATLPGCGFTAPEGKAFAAWRCNDTDDYMPGDTFTPSGDMTFNALWLTPQTLTFTDTTVTDTTVSKRYGDAAFTNAVAGANTTVTWYSSDSTVATVNKSTGEVTLVGVGETTIHATAARSSEYASASAGYTLKVLPKLVENPTVTVNGSFTYTGAAIKPEITVKDGDTVIPAGEYSVAYTNNVKAGTATVTVTDVAGGVYDLVTAAATFEIDRKPVTVSGITAANKHYDEDTFAKLDFSGVTFAGLVDGDRLTVTAEGAFDTADYGANKTVHITILALMGRDVSNYTLAGTGNQATATADIYAPHTVKFVSEDGKTPLADQTVRNGNYATEPVITPPVKDGYRFVGWQDQTGAAFDFSKPLEFENTTTVTLKPRFSRLYDVFAKSGLQSNFKWKSAYSTGEAASVNIQAIEGETICVLAVPGEGQVFTGFDIIGQAPRDSGYEEVPVPFAVKEDGHAEFTMPAYPVCISGGFVVSENQLDALRDENNANLYHIRSANDLMLLMQWKGAENDLAGITLQLDNDIDMGGSICTGFQGAFKGTFDGKSHTIADIHIHDTSSSSSEYVGFIWNLQGEVKDLTITGVASALGNNYKPGGLVGKINEGGKITNCTAIISGDGRALAYFGSGTVTGCYYGKSDSQYGTRLYTVEAPEYSQYDIAVSNVTGTNSRTIDGVQYFVFGSDVTMNITAAGRENYTLAGFQYYDGTTLYDMTGNADGTYKLPNIHSDVRDFRPIYQYNIDLSYENNEYLISSVEDLNKVVQAAKATGGCPDMVFKLTTDLTDVGEFEGIAVGTSESFYGTFNGDGHTISGMTITSGAVNVGFIGTLSGTLRNLTLKNCQVTCENESGKAGMLAGYAEYGNMTDCVVTGGSVTGASAGAICGSNVDGSNNLYTTDVQVVSGGETKTPGECGTPYGDRTYNDGAILAWTVSFVDGLNANTALAAPQIVANNGTAQKPTVTNPPEHKHFTWSDQWQRGNGDEYTFDSVKQADDITADTTLYAAWNRETRISVTLSDDAENGQTAVLGVYASDAENGWALPACAFVPATGMAFDKWKYNDSEYSAGDTITFTGNITVTAKWKAADYTITTEAAHGKVSAAETAHYNDTVTLTATPDTGYELEAYTVNDPMGNVVTVTDNTFTMPANNVTVTAAFKPVEYTIDASIGDGALWVDDRRVTDLTSATAHYGETVWVSPPEGMALGSMTVDEDPCTEGIFSMPAKNVSLRTTYVQQYTVTYDSNGGDGSWPEETVTDGATCTLPKADTFLPPEGKTFKEWSVKIGEAEAVSKQPDETITVTANTAVTAVWVPVFGPATFTLPAAIRTIEESAFEGNPAMIVVYVPDTCTRIDANAFKGCTGLTQIRLPKNCTIDGTAFSGCTNLIAIYAPAGGTTETWANGRGIPFAAE